MNANGLLCCSPVLPWLGTATTMYWAQMRFSNINIQSIYLCIYVCSHYQQMFIWSIHVDVLNGFTCVPVLSKVLTMYLLGIKALGIQLPTPNVIVPDLPMVQGSSVDVINCSTYKFPEGLGY